MRKGVAYLFRYRDVSLQANCRYLTALAEVENPTAAIPTLDRITTRKQVAPKRTAKAFNPLARDETQIFGALLDGQHMIRGFSNPDIRQKLQDSPHMKHITDSRRQSAKVRRIFNRCHAHGLIVKIPHSRRWRLTRLGRFAMSASIQRCSVPNYSHETHRLNSPRAHPCFIVCDRWETIPFSNSSKVCRGNFSPVAPTAGISKSESRP
jgi:hypothetical protein